MKLHQIAIAVAALAAGTASAATVTFTVSGATALNKSFEKTALDMCDTAQPSATYSYNGSVSGTKAAVRYECKAKSGLGISGVSTGDTLIINKEQGGSGNGVKQVNNSTTVTVSNTTCTTSTVDGTYANRTHWTGCGYTTAVPTAGMSDVEPKLLYPSAADNGNLKNDGIVAQVFGMAVSDNVYQKLQALQGKIVGDYSEAQAPSLPASFVRGTFSGVANDWTAVDPSITEAAHNTDVHPNQPGFVDANANTTAVKICRRASGSGTLATFEATVMLNPCSTSALYGGNTVLSNYLGDDTGANDTNQGYLGETDVYTVVQSSSTEDVDTCLTRAYYQGEMAIGIMGTERQPGDTGSKTAGSDDNDGPTDKWHFVKIGQVYPSVANFVAGDYDFYWAEASFNRRKTGYSALETNMMNYFLKNMGDPAKIVSIPLPGLAALTTSGYTFDYGVSPVARASRGGNTCRMGTQVY